MLQVTALAVRHQASAIRLQASAGKELDYQLLLACGLAYLPAEVHTELKTQVSEVERMRYRFIRSLADA